MKQSCCSYFALKLAAALAVLCVTGCSTYVGKTIEIRELPSFDSESRSMPDITALVALEEIKDVRGSIPSSTVGDDNEGRITSPEGDVGRIVQDSLAKALLSKGIGVSSRAPLRIWGEIRRWRARITTTATSSIKSDAALYLEVIDNSGSRVYSGTYHGTRASEFPVASLNDFRDSLGLAMLEAVAQAVDDQQFLDAVLVK